MAEPGVERPRTARIDAVALAGALGRPSPTDQQRAVIEAPLGPALVVAGAGSGKTETMAMRVLWLVANRVVQPSEILGLTFTRKAASELGDRVRERLATLAAAGLAPHYDPFDPPVVSTYNAFANTLYRDHAVRIGRESDGVVLGDAAAWQLARRVVVQSTDPALVDLDRTVDTVTATVLTLANGMGEHAADPSAVLAYAARCRAALDALPYGASAYPGEFETATAAVRTLPVLLRLVEAFQAEKRSLGAVQYSDQVALALAITDAAPDVVQRLRDRHRVVLLDEYQDTSVVQTRLLARLFAGSPVMAVGDPHQSIYGWRGASAANLDDFPRDFGATGADAQHALSTSWRNGTRILAAANAVAAELTAQTRVAVEQLAPAPSASDHEVESVFAESLGEEAAAAAAWFAERLDEPDSDGNPPSAALLLRARRTLPEFLAAFRAAGVRYHVLGVGGLLLEPEVADLVAALRVVHDADAGPELLRLLAGGRWRVGPADLAALQRLARWLERRDAREHQLEQHVADALDRSIAEGESASIVDALDFLIRRPGHGAAAGFSAAGLARLCDAAQVFAGLRTTPVGDLTAFVHLVVETLGLDIEAEANEQRGSLAALQAFDDAVTGFLGIGGQATLGAFLGWLQAAEVKEDLSPRVDPPEPGTVQVLTVHGSKGLEWDLVAVPRLVGDELPSRPKSGTNGWLTIGALPWPLRGDAAELPVFDWPGFTDRKALKSGLAAFKREVGTMLQREERRLAYVAITRARHRLLLTGSFWATQKASREPSVFLRDLAAAGVIAALPDAPQSAEAPESAPTETFVWPADPLGGRRAVVESAARAVETATGDGGRWAPVVGMLLAERERGTGPGAVPDRIPASRFKDYIDDAAAVVDVVRRPMPERPYRATRLGTRFHAWVEARAGVAGSAELVDADQLELDLEPETGDSVALEALQTTFAASEWGALEPLEVETEIQLPFEGRVLVCKIDAVYRREGRLEIVDWKTGTPPASRRDIELRQFQLALYRFAFAARERIPPEDVDAAFYYVAADRVVRPERLMTEAELRSAWSSAVASGIDPVA